jgi:hypothetical protein
VTREHAPRPGVRWEIVVQRAETVVPDDEEPARPNRAGRRAEARARRKGKRGTRPQRD